MVLLENPKHRLNIETMAKAELPEEQFSRVSVVLSAEEVKTQLAEIDTRPQPKETVVRGYTIKTHFSDTDPVEAKRRRGAFIRAVMSDDTNA